MTIQSGIIDVAIPSRLISQTIDSLCYEIILKPEVREKRNETLQEFLRNVDNVKMAKFGRLQCSILLANLILKLNKKCDSEGECNLEYWEVDDWKDFVEELKELRSKIIRKDATAFITFPLLKFGTTADNNNNDNIMELENEEINEAIVSKELFDSKFDNVLDMCFFHWAMSYIRLDVEDAMNGPKGSVLDVGDDEVAALHNFIQNRFNEGDNFYDHLTSLFKENNSQKEETSDHQHQLKSVKDVFEIMNRNCLSLDRFRKITERLLQNWYINVFSEPVLVSIGYTKSYRKDDLGESQTNSFELSNELRNNDTSANEDIDVQSFEETATRKDDDSAETNDETQNDSKKPKRADKKKPLTEKTNKKKSGQISQNHARASSDDTIQYSVEDDQNFDLDNDNDDDDEHGDESSKEETETRLSRVGNIDSSPDDNIDNESKVSVECESRAKGKRKRDKPRRYAEEFITAEDGVQIKRIEKQTSLTPPKTVGTHKRHKNRRIEDESTVSGDELDNCSLAASEAKSKENEEGKVKSNTGDEQSVAFDVEEIPPYDPKKKRLEAKVRLNKIYDKLKEENEGKAKEKKKSSHTIESIEQFPDSQSSKESILSEKRDFHNKPRLATSHPRGKMYIESSDSEEEHETPKKKPKKLKKSANKKEPLDFDGSDDEEERFRNLKKPKRRKRKWTLEEKNAVRTGYLRYGHNWNTIKQKFPIVLQHRTNVNIKDCFRTMSNRGDI